MEPIGPTDPEAGVMATSPAMAPEAMPSTLGLPWRIHSQDIHASAAAAVASWVTASAIPATPSAANSEPALNPNQPTHSMAAPTMVYARLFGSIGVTGYPRRGPRTSAAASPAMPALMWTTVPPAKSRMPYAPSQPPPHTQ